MARRERASGRSSQCRTLLRALRNAKCASRVVRTAVAFLLIAYAQFAPRHISSSLQFRICDRRREEQRSGIGMSRITADLIDRSTFHDPSAVEDDDSMGQVSYDGDVVTNKQVRQSFVLLKIPKKIEDLRLHGEVQGADGLVTDNEPRFNDHRSRDGNALTLSAGKCAVDIGSRRPRVDQRGRASAPLRPTSPIEVAGDEP